MLSMKVLYFWHRTGPRSFYQESLEKAKVVGSQREGCPGTSLWLLGVDAVDRKQRFTDDDICKRFQSFPATKKDVTRKLKSHFNQLRSVFRGRAMLAATVSFFLWGPALQVAVMKSS